MNLESLPQEEWAYQAKLVRSGCENHLLGRKSARSLPALVKGFSSPISTTVEGEAANDEWHGLTPAILSAPPPLSSVPRPASHGPQVTQLDRFRQIYSADQSCKGQ